MRLKGQRSVSRFLSCFTLCFALGMASVGNAGEFDGWVKVRGENTLFFGGWIRESIQDVFQPTQIPSLFDGFTVQTPGWETTQEKAKLEGKETVIRYRLKKTDGSDLQTQPKRKESFLSSLMSELVNSIYVDVAGRVTRTEEACDPKVFDPKGYRFRIDLAESSRTIRSFTSKVTLKICIKNKVKGSEGEGVLVAHQFALEPGPLFPKNPQSKSYGRAVDFMRSLVDNFRRVLEDKVIRAQVLRVQHSNPDSERFY
ncbi:MAG: hypothetical protein HYX41_03925 [Bdellovibrio sp.]|nr:hypothetical protein [Bdellovibrio sp.]